MPAPTPIPTPFFVNVITYDDLTIIVLLAGILMFVIIRLILYVLFNVLLRSGGAKKP